MIQLRHGLRRWRIGAAGLAAVAAFAVLAGRFWHPYYGFTKFVQLDEADRRIAIHEIREHPVYAYPGFNGYDGGAYVQIAFHPLLDSPELAPALGNVPYRARRILGSALAWLLAGGAPDRIANRYAALNLAVWIALAALLWRVLPVVDARTWLAWAGVLFSAGALHSVRLALTDLLATTLLTAAIGMSERGRAAGAAGWLAAAGLARETALAAGVALWRGPWRSTRAWARNLLVVLLVALPLGAWVVYVRWKAGPAEQGLGNFAWPIIGWVKKWGASFADFGRHPEFRWLNTTTLLALVALSAQALYLLRRWRWGDPWWRAGIASVALMAMVGSSVWEGHPGAVTRVLLPMGVAFAVLAVRERASWGWVAAGSLTVFSGVLALWHVPADAREIGAGRQAGGGYVARLESGWFDLERHGAAAWAWSGGRGQLVIETSPRGSSPLRVRLKVRAITPRAVEIRAGPTLLWRGNVTGPPAWIELPAVPREQGRIVLELASDIPPEPESGGPGARWLGFALYGVELRNRSLRPRNGSKVRKIPRAAARAPHLHEISPLGEQLGAQGDEPGPQWLAARGERPLVPLIVRAAGRRLDRNGLETEGPEIVGAGAHVDRADVARQLGFIKDGPGGGGKFRRGMQAGKRMRRRGSAARTWMTCNRPDFGRRAREPKS